MRNGTGYYHYTSSSSFEAIINLSSLRFTHFEDLNDKKEVEFSVEQIEKHTSELGLVKALPHNIREILQEQFMPFIASFSDSPNHLSLWRYYGDMSFGFSIGFESKLKLIGDQPTLAKHPIRAKVNYGEKSCNQVINTLIELYTNFIHKAGAVARSEQGMQKAARSF